MNGPRMRTPTPLPNVADQADAAFSAGLWHGTVIGMVLGFAAAVLFGLLK